jgi:hypothetical protein
MKQYENLIGAGSHGSNLKKAMNSERCTMNWMEKGF